ncbi:TolC family outer membrane protein [Cupriavidus basilensis]|uniref:TolC family outer membrane protein n=1 Tax=Cupriavidus basilensis TaxID=68895 RepID=A0ABT6B4D2_9BURK|nr:TolC family outer membrane protein [Cupriavidus basilensis]MDF3839745.1 TolC family outer membrane protein [Cupriavidus basilensis]
MRLITIGRLALLLACSSAQAEDLLDAWRAARAHDAYFAAAGDAWTAGMEQAQQGDAGVLPVVSLDGNAKRVDKDYRSGMAATSSKHGFGQQYSAAVSVVAPIYNRAAFVTRDQSRRQTEQARLRYLAAEQELILRAAKAYFDVLIAQENVNLVKAQSEAAAQQLAQAQKMFEIGLASVTDRDDAQARFDTIMAAGIAARNDLEVRANAYRTLTSLDPARVRSISPAVSEAAVAPEALVSLLSQARLGNLTVQAQQQGAEIARLEIDRFRLESSPVLSLVASVGHQFDHGSISSSGGRDRTLNGVVGLQLSIPLYTGGARESRLRQAHALAGQQANTLEALQRDAEQQAQQYFLDMVNGSARVRALEQARASAQTSVASSKLGRQLGVRTVIEVLNAEQAYYQTLFNLVVARYGVLFSKLQLAAAIGNLQEPELASVNAWLTGPAASALPAIP